MYFQQSKLTKDEWENCEIPVSLEEKKILYLIKDGFQNTNIKYNDNQSIAQYMKIEHTPEIETFLYTKYFKPLIDEMIFNCSLSPTLTEFVNTNFSKTKQIKKMDSIRLSNLDANIEKHKKNIYEFVLLDFCKHFFLFHKKTKTENTKKNKNINTTKTPVNLYIYNLIQLKKIHNTIIANQWVIKFVSHVINYYIEYIGSLEVIICDIFHNSYDYIENNSCILKYENKTLFEHQKQLFSLFNKNHDITNLPSRLVFYTAPTGTGKTLSPLGLSNKYKIIYICASRLVGLAFAKNAISIEKKVAFAFGCETADDIRLHYFSAKDYEINRISGGIYKVNNSNGEKVEIMICDLSSYLVAMYYMLSFNNEKNCILYWDEPTISLDVSDSPLHKTIHEIWKNNSISNIILSCATLPTETELLNVIEDFNMKFDNTEIHTINSYDCKKTISLINKDKYSVLPHFFFEKYTDLLACVNNCQTNRAILRYFNLKEIVIFIETVIPLIKDINPLLTVSGYFQTIEEITMNEIKLYYLKFLSEIPNEKWNEIYQHIKPFQSSYWNTKKENESLKKIKSVDIPNSSKDIIYTNSITRTTSISSTDIRTEYSHNNVTNTHGSLSSGDGVLLTTIDAHTLTDGASIYFAEDVEKIGKFLIYQSKIPESVITKIAEKIASNEKNKIQIETITKSINDKIGKDAEKERKMEKDNFTPEVKRMIDSLESLKSAIHSVTLEPQYVPNTHQHQMIWWDAEKLIENAFVPNIDQCSAEEVMSLDVTTQMKLLLLLGIGVFSNQVNGKYMEIMKRLAIEERLYLIIANCDFIYGMNYQMCHGFLGKDLKEMTQQKIIQAIGRIGRGNIQQEYTIRIRDDNIFNQLFLPQEKNLEAENMCRLFNSFE